MIFTNTWFSNTLFSALVVMLTILVVFVFSLMLLGLLSSLIFDHIFRDHETLSVLIILSVFIIFLTNIRSVLILGLMVGAGLACAHGVFRVLEDLVLDEQEPSANTRFLSFPDSAALNAVAATLTISTCVWGRCFLSQINCNLHIFGIIFHGYQWNLYLLQISITNLIN